MPVLDAIRADIGSDIDSDSASDTTLDELQSPYCVGVPLRRMVQLEYLTTPSSYDSDLDSDEGCVGRFQMDEIPAEDFVREDEINHIEDDKSLQLDDGDKAGLEGDPQLYTLNLEHVHSVIDHMAANSQALSPLKFSLYSTPHHPSHTLLVRRLQSTSASARELALWRYLNSTIVRRDPWNPSPSALIVERELSSSAAKCLSKISPFGDENEAYVVMDQLRSLRDNPFKSTGDVIDFSRQMLQGLVFLHEHSITQASYTLSNASSGVDSIMMDIGLAPPHTPFSRYDFPVKYYILDFSMAVRLQVLPLVSHLSWITSPPERRRKVVMSPQILPLRREPYIRPLFAGSSMNGIVTLPGSCRARACSDSNVALVTAARDTSPDCVFDLETPKQRHFFARSNSPHELSDPEDTGDASERDEEDNIQNVSAGTRTLLFAADLNNVATLLEETSTVAPAVGEVLAPVVTAMRQAKIISLSAMDALNMFESAVRCFVGASMD